MIIIGTYPDGFDIEDGSIKKLAALDQRLNVLLPHNFCLHILPFYPNSGDFGFAPDDWFQIRKDLGEWKDLSRLSSHWKVLVDGIYNHVGINHKWVKGFQRDPEHFKKIIHAYKTESSDDGLKSPRGQPVLTKNTSYYYLWQTFSDAAVDIRLDSPVVQEKIGAHLSLLSSQGIWGVRLDAVAYYAKALGSQIRHNHGVYKLANTMADKVRSYGLNVLAQLDCDIDGLRYYSDNKRKNIPINDFTYSTYLALSILYENPEILINHVARTQKAGRILLRVPRTHDGILLRSKLLKKDDKMKIIDFAKANEIQVRTNNGDPYELNCSAPYLYSLLASDVKVSKTILFTVAVTGMMSGWSYFYLPYIMGHMPEDYANHTNFQDPRALNRLPIPNALFDNYLQSPSKSKTISLLNTLNTIHLSQSNDFRTIFSVNDGLLALKTVDNKYILFANFNRSKDKNIPDKWFSGEVLEQNDFNGNRLGRLGYVIMKMA